jgi:hypothetical protein
MRTPITAAFTAAAILLSDSIGTLAADADGQSGLTANTQTIAEFTKDMNKIGGFLTLYKDAAGSLFLEIPATGGPDLLYQSIS